MVSPADHVPDRSAQGTVASGVATAARPPIWDLMHNRGFLKLFGTRLTGSVGDGILQAALATFVLFSPERQPTPLAIAASFGILLLPYSFIGPFAGVFLDRWRRRQVLVFANWLRAVTTVGVILVVATGRVGVELGLIVLATLGLGRFVLSGLSAALPHVVPQRQLVTANSLAPTAGTVVYGIGALVGIGIRGLAGGGDQGIRWVLISAAVVYVAAGLIPLSLRADQLGPTGDRPGQTFAGVARGFVDGFSVLRSDAASWRAVTVVLLNRLAFGSLTVLLLLVLRNTLNPPTDADSALADFAIVAGAATVGALGAALITPSITRRLGTIRWTTITLVISGIAAPVLLFPVTMPALTAAGFVLGLTQQAAKIGGDTTLQRRISDDHLGRVFSLYDVGVNVALVAGALLVAVTAPPSGVSIIGFLALGMFYLVIAAWYRRTREDAPAGRNTSTT